MDEETQLWGVAVEGYDKSGHPTSTLLVWKGTTPERKPFRLYPVFDSKQRAAQFVGTASAHVGDLELTNNLVDNNVRRIKRNEIPDDHRVFLSDRKGVVTWAALLAEGE
jgi:hypothetical protein